MVNIPRDTKESWLMECGLCLRFSDHLKIVRKFVKPNMSIMMEYISGIWSIKDSCYECRIIRSLDMRILYKGSQKNIGLVYCSFWSG